MISCSIDSFYSPGVNRHHERPEVLAKWPGLIDVMDVINANDRGRAPMHEARDGDNIVTGAGQDCDAVFYENIYHPVLRPTGLPFYFRRGSGPENFSVRAYCVARP
jgi:hypothetical protein